MPNPTRDEIKQAAELVISMAVQYRELFDPDHTHPHEIVARAYLALRAQVDAIGSMANFTLHLLDENHITSRTYYEQMAFENLERIAAAIKAIEEGR